MSSIVTKSASFAIASTITLLVSITVTKSSRWRVLEIIIASLTINHIPLTWTPLSFGPAHEPQPPLRRVTKRLAVLLAEEIATLEEMDLNGDDVGVCEGAAAASLIGHAIGSGDDFSGHGAAL
ncbi:hypothetical protein BDQ12DRAFT_669843 [Crucibulum laeve]|uniref:Uncharacterized protein n=1 Tax=Crucibulum laeve TaxID=68775 RepID=A0A5C3LYR6_9AGAR|nr:hypothetical protein BDQ12DRAFT_669843 [Crucibulum laeve]